MEDAALRDNDSILAGEAALAKHKMLPEVVEMLNRTHMHEILLDSGILSAIRLWLEPLPNRSLPAIHLRKALLELLRNLPIETDHLRESEVGKIIMFFARRPKEVPEIQRLAKELVSRWSRPIIVNCSRATIGENDEQNIRIQSAPRLQSLAYQEMAAGKIADAGLSSQQKKLVIHMQKRSKSKKSM